MKRRVLFVLFLLLVLTIPVLAAEPLQWVEFDVSCEAMERALELEEQYLEQDHVISWIDILAVAAASHGGGNFSAAQTEKAAEKLVQGSSPYELKCFSYWKQAYEAVLGGIAGTYAITLEDGTRKVSRGIKAFSPIAAGYQYEHYDDFGNSRSYGFRRRHLGNDLLGSLGTPIVAVEGGTVEAMGWNQYGGWRVGIRSRDRKRYYYYAHLRKDTPFAPGLELGSTVQAGDVIGFMGRTGYSAKENVNNIETVHLHFGLQLIFDESQKDCDNEIWVDVYELVKLLERHKSSVRYDETTKTWQRIYPYFDLDQTENETLN